MPSPIARTNISAQISSGIVRILPDGTSGGTSNVTSLTISGDTEPTARLDVTNNAFVIDYTGSIKVVGGSTVTMIAQDTNCTTIRNCTDPPDNNQCMSTGVPNLDPVITQKIGGNGSAYNGQFIGMTVTSVTSP